ncbi:MAG TPA: AMP-binding protein [Longimicrobiales bacterium]|nr:AMP-binding protein [Longimicrobiales bacterium]
MSELLAGHPSGAVALVDADQGLEVTYGELRERVGQSAAWLRRELEGGLVFHVATNTPASIALYLACLEARCPVALLEPAPADRLEPLLRAYGPDAVLLPADTEMPAGRRPGPMLPEAEYRMALRRAGSGPRPLHPDLALLLTTSGSTGSPKLVRLTRGNVAANARSIVEYLAIGPGERSVQSLPMHYSYGLSLVNSHLLAGATVVVTRHSFMRPEFWGAFDRAGCTSLAGVPYVYETLHRLRFDPARHPSLRTLTQAGGGLRPDLIQAFHDRARAAGARFFVMYGQTEATARIAYVPWERLGEKIGFIGVAIPRGRLSLAPVEDSEQQELIYEGPNVMMGYADSAADLAAGDELNGTLRTGDLAAADGEGFFKLTGRLKRVAKLFGRRISLEELEHELQARYPVDAAVVDRDGRLLVFAVARGDVDLTGIGHSLARQLGVPPKSVHVEAVAAIPLTASGKKDYKALPS